MNNKRITAILLTVILVSSALAACSTAHPAEINETTTVVESTIPGEITVSGTAAADETTLPFSDISDIKKPTTQERTTARPGTEQKPSAGTTIASPATTKPVTTTKPKTTTTTRPITTTRPTTTKPTTTTTKPALSTPTKAQIDEIVRGARAYGESLGNVWSNSLTIENSSWSSPPNSKNQTLNTMKDDVYYQLKKWTNSGNFYFKVLSKKLSDGNYEIYVLRG